MRLELLLVIVHDLLRRSFFKVWHFFYQLTTKNWLSQRANKFFL